MAVLSGSSTTPIARGNATSWWPRCSRCCGCRRTSPSRARSLREDTIATMGEPVVNAAGLTKTYKVYATPWDRLGELITRRRRHRAFQALEEVTFSLPRAEGLALIGENGAGKSTLLKILAGITAPTSGSFEVRGKVASILELGSGFHPEFTGRQNVVLNAAMLGLSPEELRRKMPDIVGFSELGEFIDQPVKTYSTGMVMRLGFSI